MVRRGGERRCEMSGARWIASGSWYHEYVSSHYLHSNLMAHRRSNSQMIEKHAAAQSSALSDLQMELRSLKTLLQSRQAAWQASSSSTASPPPQSLANGRSNGTNGNIENNGLHNPSPVQHAANALLTPKGTRGIPAWQLPAKDQMSNGDGTSSVSERETASSSNGQQDED